MASIKIFSQIHGSTLVEILVAFTILLICISIAAMTITGLERSRGNFDYLDAWIAMHNVATDSKLKFDFSESVIHYDQFSIKRSIEPSSFSTDVYILEIRVFDTGNHLRIQYKSLILPYYETQL